MILLVEDNPADVALTRRAFKVHNIANDIAVARNGVEALAYLLGLGAPDGTPLQPLPQVVLLDLKLPKIDGLAVLRQIRAAPRTRLLPVVVLTSSDEQRDMVTSYGLGANGYVRKPVDFTEFVEATKILGLYWLVLNKTPLEGSNVTTMLPQ